MASSETPDVTVLNYRIGKEIGRGSFATVYRASSSQCTPRTVAIKSVLRSKLTKKLQENLESEIAILKGIKHAHIVTLIDIQKSPTHIHLLMEFCPLGDLSYFIKKRETLGQIDALKMVAFRYPCVPGAGLHETLVRHFLKQLASALQFLRSKNLMHRDVKPQNLLLQPAAQPRSVEQFDVEHLPILKLADFGFARYLQTSSMAETLCGSPLYMAPEILRYEKYDASADLWSVGTVLYEMLVGKPPFRAANHVELLRKIDKSEDKIKFPEMGLNTDIQELIRALLKRNPHQRMTFQDFFAYKVLSESVLIEGHSGRFAAHGSGHTSATKPIEMPFVARPTSLITLASESPAFITDLMPHNTPPAQPRQIKVSRRETMPVQAARPRLPPTETSKGAVPMDRRPSQRSPRPSPAPQHSSGDHDGEAEYIFVEKRTVEVNALADAIAASPRQTGHPPRKSVRSASANANQITVQTLATAERRLGSSPTSALAKALSIASQRLFGGASPPGWLETMVNTRKRINPPQIFSFSDVGDQPANRAEESLIEKIEICAVRSNVVYDFAEVKLRQLIPPPPSRSSEATDAILTNEAVVSLCEEAMVLYLKVLNMLQRNIDRVQDFCATAEYQSASLRLNSAVQWTRDRYNEVLEKAEYIHQKRMVALSSVVQECVFEEVTAEKLLYDRALELGRGAAVNELVGEDLLGCEVDYEASILMLEATLEGEETMEEEDKTTIQKWSQLTKKRLAALRKKLDLKREGEVRY